MTDNKTQTSQYYGSDGDDNDHPIPGPSAITPLHKMEIKQPQGTHLPAGHDINTQILSNLSEINNKLDDLIGRISALEQGQRAILDTVMEMKRSFPKFITPAITPAFRTMEVDRRLL